MINNSDIDNMVTEKLKEAIDNVPNITVRGIFENFIHEDFNITSLSDDSVEIKLKRRRTLTDKDMNVIIDHMIDMADISKNRLSVYYRVVSINGTIFIEERFRKR